MGNGANVRGGVLYALMVLCLTCDLIPVGEAIWMNLPSSGTKCVSEEIQNNVVVLADYVVISEDHTHPSPTIAVKVQSIPFFTLPRHQIYLIFPDESVLGFMH